MGVYVNIQVLLLVLLQTIVMGASGGVCPRLKSKFCLDFEGLGYDKTFFPNLMGHSDQKQAKEAMKPYEALAETGCSKHIQAFICASFLPACPEWKDVPKKAQKPCRELCEKARKDCEDTLVSDLGMEWPAELDCDTLPSDDPTRRNPVCTNFVPPRPETTTAPPVGSSPSFVAAEENEAVDFSSNETMSTTMQAIEEEEKAVRPSTSTVAPSTEYVSTREPDGLPVIRSISDNKVVLSGGSVEFFCLASGVKEYSWKRIDGAYPDDKVDVEDWSRVGGAVLRMIDLAPEDAGIYACVATNVNGYVEALVTLTVVVAPTIRNIDTPQLASEGSRLEIDCMGEGVPQPTVIWERKDGEKVKTKGPDNRKTLIIKRADISDAGTYFCIAANQAGHANYTVEVLFESPVEIVDDINPQIIVENETAFFVCTATGFPAPEFTWRKLDGPFPDEERVVIEGPTVNNTLSYPSYTSILGIEPAYVEDTGTYQCYASNSVGNYTAVGELLVRGPPGFSQKPEPEQSVSVGDFAYFTCIVSGAPPYDVIWTKEGDPEWPGDDSRVVMEEDNMFLRISDVVPEDSGVYTCTVASDLGSASAQSYLQVEALPSTAVVEDIETDALTGTLLGETGGTIGELDSTMATELEFVTQLPTDATAVLLETIGTDGMTTLGKYEAPEGTPESTGARPAVRTSMPPATEPEKESGLLLRRTDITNPGVRGLFSGWVDVQGQGAANDFCRIIEDTEKGNYVLACSLAGTEGEEEFNYVSAGSFDIGEAGTFYMKDENGDGRFDYCRCAAVEEKRYVWCTAAGENGFYGNEDAEPLTNQYSFKAEGDKSELKRCRRRFVDPFFGIPY